MHYFKSALAGFSMSFIGTFLCAAMVVSYERKFNNPWDISKGWNFPKAFLANNIICIPTAMLGAAYHDYLGRSVADKFNLYFKTDISPYLLDTMPFGILGAIGTSYMIKDAVPRLDFMLSLCGIRGFVIGCTAALGAYCGDEKPQIETEIDLIPLEIC